MFDKDSLLDALAHAKGGEVGQFAYSLIKDEDGSERPEHIEFVKGKGCIEIHEYPTPPQKGRLEQYVIGGDTSGEGSDYYTAKVVSCLTRRTVATLRVRLIDDDVYAAQLYALGKMYHDALVTVEVNFCPTPVKLLGKWGYDNLYRREGEDIETGAPTLRVGFRTTAVTRPLVLSALKRVFREDARKEPHAETLREMLSFVRNEGRWEAASGKHDDLVMALAIAHYAAEGQDPTREEPPREDDWLGEHFDLSPKVDNGLWD